MRHQRWLAGVAGFFDRQLNRTRRPGRIAVTPEAEALHERITVADLHADPLLWNRDLLVRADHGHVDVPRLVEGNVALQVFGLVSRVPLTINMQRNVDVADLVTLLSKAHGWPAEAKDSELVRVLAQARALHDAAARSHGVFVVIHSRAELDAYLLRRQTDRHITAGLLGIEGAYPLEGRIENLETLREAGVRLFGLSHFLDGEVAGSAHGWRKGGLSALGRQVIARCEELRITVDLAHASAAAFDETLALATRPVVVSHTGVRATCDGTRNLSDAQIDAVARNGGVIGIAFFSAAVGGIGVDRIIDAIAHVARRAGVRHVALGSDFDGAVGTFFDASGMPVLTEALLARGFTDDEIAAIMGGNTVRLLRDNLP